MIVTLQPDAEVASTGSRAQIAAVVSGPPGSAAPTGSVQFMATVTQGGPTALPLGTAQLTPLPGGSSSAAALEAALPAGLLAVRGSYLGGGGAEASLSAPVNVSSGLVCAVANCITSIHAATWQTYIVPRHLPNATKRPNPLILHHRQQPCGIVTLAPCQATCHLRRRRRSG